MPKALMIGIDGASLDIIRKLGPNLLPNFHRLMNRGLYSPMKSPLPITPAAWTSIATGMNPGKHGLGDFLIRKPGTYDYTVANRTLRKVDAFWNILAREGLRSVVINYPVTYPPENTNGLMVSGMLTPGLDSDFIYPKKEKSRFLSLAPSNYKIFLDTPFKEGGDGFLDDAIQTMKVRAEFATAAYEEYEWDLFAFVLMGVDNASHMFYHVFDETHPTHDAAVETGMRNGMVEAYCEADRIVGEFAAKDSHDYLIVLSDHGFGPLHYYANLNNVLEKAGLLKYNLRTKLKPGSGKNAYSGISWKKTKAYSLGITSPISINIAGRDPEGCVRPQDVDSVASQVEKALKALKRPDNGRSVLDRLISRTEFAWGPYKDLLPDYIALMDGMRIVGKGLTYEDILFPEKRRREMIFIGRETGTHDFPGFLCITSRGQNFGGQEINTTVYDPAPTLYDIFGLEVKGLDGSSVLGRQ